ncbi:Plant calmodulin-binding protein-related [Raphanus sativus]|uniref:Uncharacterized protein LOC108845622 n=1 Tax=Raphanus sativus TaxID=3726 RepID=A0A6J0MQX8_RAPSA|nr:uncharacterized protein LOC108845622 [Raphanus sativus]KAJ4908338.1 Plant calmodulin-binding protein-related [Raphanus sativus]
MAEETVRCLPDSPDVNRSWRRISTRKLSFLYTEETLLPNYLRSPTGSCHDACKYGGRQEDKKPRRVFSPLKRVNRSFSGTLSFVDSPLRKKKKKALLTNSFGSDGGCEVSRVCDVKKKAVVSSLSDSKRKKTGSQSHSFKKTVVVSRRRALEMVEHDKRVTALKLKSVAQTAAMALRRSTVNRKKIISGGTEASEPKKVAAPLRVAAVSSKRCSRSLKKTKKEGNSLSSKQTRKMVDDDDDKCKDLVEEKTMYVIKMNTGYETFASDQNQRCVMDPPTDDPKSEECLHESPQEEVDEANDESPQAIENEKTTRQVKIKPLSTESPLNDKSMRLMRFKRGKVLGVVGSQDNNSPRKLKFKRGKIVAAGADTSSTKASSQRSLKTKETNFRDDKEEEQHKPKPKPLEVVLKHQEDTEKKKSCDSRALLFNNVIEETANKLVETRKSKVKALVGAFESVISLQERNSSPATTTT